MPESLTGFRWNGGTDPLPDRGRVSVDVTCAEGRSSAMRDLHLNNETCLNGKTTCPLGPGVSARDQDLNQVPSPAAEQILKIHVFIDDHL